jgi:NTE family protein
MKGNENKPYKLALVLSGGVARGFAHLGVIKAMEEFGLRPDIISGSSAGSIVGAFYADGYQPEEILELFIEKKLFQLIRVNVNRKGFLKPVGLEELIEDKLRAKQFHELKIPLYIAASDMNRGKAVYFSEGSIKERIIASSAIPVLFQPVIIDGTLYADGGLIDNLPVTPVLGKSEMIIGVSVNPNYEDFELNRYLKLMERTLYLSLVANIQEYKKYCDLFIEPLTMKNYSLFEIRKAREMMEVGYKEARKLLPGWKEREGF